MKIISRLVCLGLCVVVLSTMFVNYLNNGNNKSLALRTTYSSYHEIPGVTQEEKDAIIELAKKYESFNFAMMPNTEAYENINGEIEGYTELFCEWLTTIFDITFIPKHVSWNELLDGLEDNSLDFSGTLTATEERKKIYHMTDAIAHRTVKYIRLANSKPLEEIRQERLPRYAMLEGTTTVDKILNSADEAFEPVYISEYIDAYELLKNDEIDALVAEGTAEAIFDFSNEIIAFDFLPLIYTPVSLTTQNLELKPIIQVVQKALNNGANSHLSDLYNQGYQKYIKHKFFLRLTKEELAYIENHKKMRSNNKNGDDWKIPFGAEYEKYPISYYNTRIDEWQGVAFDIISEIEKLTDLEFKVVNDVDAEWPELLAALEEGKASFVTELYRTANRKGRFLWTNSSFFTDKVALISKSEYPNINVNEILTARVGISKDTAFAELFLKWFPDHHNYEVYNSKVEIFDALANDEIDLAMTYLNNLLYLTHYQEVSGYKANFVFNYDMESTFGFNKNEQVLCSIIDKAMELTDTEMISGRWLRRTYDYRARISEAQIPWIFGFVCLFLFVLVYMIGFYTKNAQKRKEAFNYKYANELSGALAEITKAETISAGILKDAAHMLAHQGCHALNVSCVGVWLATEDGNTLKSVVYYNIRTDEFIVQDDFELSDLVEYKKLFDTKRLIITNNVRESDIWSTMVDDYNPELCALLDIPIRIDGKLAGAICIEQLKCKKYQNKREWMIEEQNFASSLADLMALAIISAERKKARDSALEANRAKSEFLATMSHEIRTPMNSIMGFAELALNKTESEIPPQILEYFNKIKDSTRWLLNIVNDILDISKIEAGKVELEHVSFDLHDIISRCESVILPEAKAKSLTLKVQFEPLVGKKLLGDPIRLYQAIMNLLSNAVKFTNIGKVKLTSKIKALNNNTASVYVEIKDSGIGMTKEQLNKVFDPFIQADASTTRNYGGTGLGLSITKNILDLMNSKLHVESKLNFGSTFSFEVVFDTINAVENIDNLQKSQLIEKPYFNGLVLICDDNPMNQEVICEHLANVGLRTQVAENGQTGVEMVKERMNKNEEPFDLIFMDIYMPVMDGTDAAMRITSMDVTTPIIAMTANIMTNDITHYKKHGMLDYLGKPFTSQELWHLLLKYLTPVRDTKNKIAEIAKRSLTEEELKKKLLTNFVKENQTKYDELINAIKTNDVKLAHRIAHTMKGNAGLINEIKLKNAVEQVEKLLKTGILAIPQEKLDLFKTELNSVLKEYEFLLEDSGEELQPLDKKDMLDLFDVLEFMIENINPECINLLDNIRAIPNSEELVNQIENYDFESAAKSLANLKKAMN